MFFFQNRIHNKDKNPFLNLNIQRILCGLCALCGEKE